MNQDIIAFTGVGPSIESSDSARIDELCVPVAQVVAASISGTILVHYSITPKVTVQRQDI